jgi:hypothetical protein
LSKLKKNVLNMKNLLKLLNKYQILNVIKILLLEIKSLIKRLFKLVIRMLIINFLICVAVTLCNKKWNIIINLFLNNIFTTWDDFPKWENLKNLFSDNNTSGKFKTEVPYDLKAELKKSMASGKPAMAAYQKFLLCFSLGGSVWLLFEWLFN